MALKQKKRLTIEIKNSRILFTVGTFDGSSIYVEKAFKKELDYQIYQDNKLINEQLLAQTIKNTLIQENVKIKQCYLYISSSDIIQKNLIVPYIENPNDFDDLVITELSQTLPIDLDNYVVKYKYISEEKSDSIQKVKLNCAVIGKEVVESYKNILKQAGLKPVCLDMDTSALENLVKYIIMSNSDETGLYKNEIENSFTAFADINMSNCSITIFKAGRLDFSRIIKTPQFSEDVIQAFSEISNINELKNEEAFELLNEVLSEINMVFKYYLSRDRRNKIDELFLYGEASEINDFDKYTQDIIEMSVNRIDTIQDIVGDNFKQNVSTYMTTIGGLIRW